MNLTFQEKNVIDFLSSKKEIFWEELAQFCKEPSTVKLKTVKKVVSDIKKKYRDENIDIPFDCNFSSLTIKQEQRETIQFNGQSLVKLNRKPNETKSFPSPVEIKKNPEIDISIKKYVNQVITRNGLFNLNDDDFQIFEYFFNNKERVISLEELRDRVVFPSYGSKLPAKWFFSIQRRINNIRRTIPDLKYRIFTVKIDANSTGYLFK